MPHTIRQHDLVLISEHCRGAKAEPQVPCRSRRRSHCASWPGHTPAQQGPPPPLVRGAAIVVRAVSAGVNVVIGGGAPAPVPSSMFLELRFCPLFALKFFSAWPPVWSSSFVKIESTGSRADNPRALPPCGHWPFPNVLQHIRGPSSISSGWDGRAPAPKLGGGC
jgi:hypothetical protein